MHINICGGRGSGKTHILASHSIASAMSISNLEVGFYVQSATHTLHTMNTFRSLLKTMGIEAKTITRDRIIFDNGSRISVGPPEMARGRRDGISIIDNIDLLSNGVRESILLSTHGTRMLITSSVKHYEHKE